jgi:antitoxin ParD1/3/4
METNLYIDEELMNAAMRAGKFKTKRETIEAALRLLIRQASVYRKPRALGGKLEWECSLGANKAAEASIGRGSMRLAQD